MKKTTRVIASIAVALIAVACSAAGSTVTLTSGDNGRAIELRTGDELVISLDGNPTTGFDWSVATAPTPTLEQVERIFTPQSTLLGASGTVRYRFRAASEGTTTLTLNYRRSFESKPPERVFEVSVIVRPR